MKEVKAYIKSHKLSDVTLAIHKVKGITGMSVSEVRGFGRSKKEIGKRDPSSDLADFFPHIKVEIVCKDQFVDEIVSAIAKAAHTGQRGDGKIYISDIDTAIRIQTGDRGDDAI